MTPSFIGLIATMLPGVLPSMSFASLPTASTRPFTLLIATIDVKGVLYVFGRSDGGHNTVLPGFFDLIHRFVGRLDELFRRRGHVGQRRHADRGGEMDVEAVRLQEAVLGDTVADALPDRE